MDWFSALVRSWKSLMTLQFQGSVEDNGSDRQLERERERERDRQTDRDRERERDTHTHRQRQRRG